MLGYIGGYIANRDFGYTSMGVTAVAIKAAKVRDKQYKRVDSDGLHLLILPSGPRYRSLN
jgi:hypothetical protein